MLKSLLFTSLVCFALGGGALSSPYLGDTIDTNEVVPWGDYPKLLQIGSINGLDFSDNSLYYNSYDGYLIDRGIVHFRNDAPNVNKGVVLLENQSLQSSNPIRVAMYITTIPFYNSVMVEEAYEGDNYFTNKKSEVLFLHLIFSSTSGLSSTAMISIPLGFRANDLNNLPFKWWKDVTYKGGSFVLGDNYYQGFFKAKQTNAVSLFFYRNPNGSGFSITSKLYYQEHGTTYVHTTTNDIDLSSSSNDFVKFFGDGNDRFQRNQEWNNTMLEKTFYELANFSLNRVPLVSVGLDYLTAYQEGYDDGLNQNINNGGLFSVFVSMFAGLSSFLAISLFPGVTIGGIALIFLVIPLTYGIIKLMRGGGG